MKKKNYLLCKNTHTRIILCAHYCFHQEETFRRERPPDLHSRATVGSTPAHFHVFGYRRRTMWLEAAEVTANRGEIIRSWQRSALSWLLSCLTFKSPSPSLSPDLHIHPIIFPHTMGLEESSSVLQIESRPSPICGDLAGVQNLDEQMTMCDFCFLKGITPAGKFLGMTHHDLGSICRSCGSASTKRFSDV